MMERTDLPACPVETTLALISNRWKALLLRDLLMGTKRFGELRRSLAGISQKVLTANLRDLEADGLLTRTAYAEVPPRVEYALTDLFDWGLAYRRANGCPESEQADALGAMLHGENFAARA